MTTDAEKVLADVRTAAIERERAATDFIESVLVARHSGMSLRKIGDAASLSHTRIRQIIQRYDYRPR